jgi:hypothetical protein
VKDAAGNLSDFLTVSVAAYDDAAPTLSAGSPATDSRTANTVNVNFTSDEAGKYYYVVANNAPGDSAAVKAAGSATETVLNAGANQIAVTGLTAAAATNIHIVATDANGNLSGILTIAIGAPRAIASVEQYGGEDGKTLTTAIKVTFDHAVTEPPASAFTVNGAAKGSVTDAGDLDDKTWTIGITGTWENGYAGITVAIATDWGGYTFADSTAKNVPVLYAPVKANTPTLAINYETETITNFTDGASYSYEVWTTADPTLQSSGTLPNFSGTTYTIPDSWLGYTLQFKRIGGANSVDSDAQPLPIPAHPAAPSPGSTLETNKNNNTATITGVSALMEYQLGSGAWADAGGATISNLVPGTYHVRVKASNTNLNFAGSSAMVTIAEFVPTPKILAIGDITIDYTNETLMGFLTGEKYSILYDGGDTHSNANYAGTTGIG